MAQRGLSELVRLFDTLPAEAEAALKEQLPIAAANILAIEKADVPVRTGDLWRGLATQSLNDGLTVRAGLVGITNGRSGKTSLGSLFYGRIVEFGRKQQVVLVERRRRVGGRLRSSRGRKIAADLYKPYKMTVPAAPPRPFVDTPDTQAAMLRAMEAVATTIEAKLQE